MYANVRSPWQAGARKRIAQDLASPSHTVQCNLEPYYRMLTSKQSNARFVCTLLIFFAEIIDRILTSLFGTGIICLFCVKGWMRLGLGQRRETRLLPRGAV